MLAHAVGEQAWDHAASTASFHRLRHETAFLDRKPPPWALQEDGLEAMTFGKLSRAETAKMAALSEYILRENKRVLRLCTDMQTKIEAIVPKHPVYVTGHNIGVKKRYSKTERLLLAPTLLKNKVARARARASAKMSRMKNLVKDMFRKREMTPVEQAVDVAQKCAMATKKHADFLARAAAGMRLNAHDIAEAHTAMQKYILGTPITTISGVTPLPAFQLPTSGSHKFVGGYSSWWDVPKSDDITWKLKYGPTSSGKDLPDIPPPAEGQASEQVVKMFTHSFL